MKHDDPSTPRLFKGVTISSTFTDLQEHRAALIKAVHGQGLTALAMENDAAKLVDVIESSLQMVRDGSAYIGVISHKYGQTPEDAERNPSKLSITELEFNQARDLGRPILLFIMGDDHQVKPGDVERDSGKMQKLAAFRESAKRMKPDSAVHRVYKVFNNLHEFEVAAMQSVAELRRFLDDQDAPAPEQPPVAPLQPKPDPIPTPPAFYAEPRYIGSHQFVGRLAQLDTLNDWAAAADPHPILLFEAIGGTGKSMLTWQWTTRHATSIRSDWAGRFWYSFYERGAVMADFCQRALAYITGQPLADFRKKKTLELGEWLLHELQARPWLLILDGLERILITYHRFDAAQLRDEEAGTSDQIANRDPFSAIRPEDDDLLRTLTAAAPSKLLLTSRLMPRVLLNPSNQAIPGVRRELLSGLRPADAEALIRACGVTGNSQAIQDYLKRHCDCHPLVTGVLAGLIKDYLPDRGNFDAWVADVNHGGHLNLADLDLVQKRNHILKAALDALPEKSRQLLSTLALLSETVDYSTLCALSPHSSSATQELTKTVSDLEWRGLLQYDAQAKRHDLHPVVRGIAAGCLGQEEKEQYSQRVVDHFSQQTHIPYEEAETLEDLRNGLNVIRALLQMGHHQQACDAYLLGLGDALRVNLEAHSEALSLLRPLFPQGWTILPTGLDEIRASHLASNAALALVSIGEVQDALAAHSISLVFSMGRAYWHNTCIQLASISRTHFWQNRLVIAERSLILALNLADQTDKEESLFIARLLRFQQLIEIGCWRDAEIMWQLLDPMGRNWSRTRYRPGDAENVYARFHFYQADLREEFLVQAEQLAMIGKNRGVIRDLHRLRGEWVLEQEQWALAANSLHEAVRMAREVGQTDTKAENGLALAKFHLNQLADPRHEAGRLSQAKKPARRYLAELWLALGDREQATKHALAAYHWAWADGEPYVHRYELDKTTELLQRLGVAVPKLPPYDPATYVKFPWEDEVVAAIERLRAEKEAKQAQERAQ